MYLVIQRFKEKAKMEIWQLYFQVILLVFIIIN